MQSCNKSPAALRNDETIDDSLEGSEPVDESRSYAPGRRCSYFRQASLPPLATGGGQGGTGRVPLVLRSRFFQEITHFNSRKIKFRSSSPLFNMYLLIAFPYIFSSRKSSAIFHASCRNIKVAAVSGRRRALSLAIVSPA